MRTMRLLWVFALMLPLVLPLSPANAQDTLGTPEEFPSLSAVDCVAPTACMAVGAHVWVQDVSDGYDEDGSINHTVPLVMAWDGRSWQELPFPSIGHDDAPHYRWAELDDVSCTRTKAGRVGLAGLYCVATGNRYESYGEPTDTPQSDYAVDLGPLTAVWNGTAWRLAEPSSGCAQLDYCTVRLHVDCSAPRRCHAVGGVVSQGGKDGGPAGVFWSWDGTAWSYTKVQESFFSGGLSCVSFEHCVLAGDQEKGYGNDTTHAPMVLTIDHGHRNFYTGRHDAAAAMVDGLDEVSCASATYCVATGPHYSLTITPDGRVYHHVRRPGEDVIAAVSCPQPGHCLAAGVQGYRPGVARIAERFVGTHWVFTQPPGRPETDPVLGTLVSQLDDLTCAGPAFCFATGHLYSASTSNPTGQVSDQPGDVPGAGPIMRWNGHQWSDVAVQIQPYEPTA